VVEGAYYSKLLLLAKEQKRIDFVPLDPLMQVRAYFDIGGTGARADAVSIWIAQFVGQKGSVMDCMKRARAGALGPPGLDRSRGWDKAWVMLPHDGAHGDKSLRRPTKARSAKLALTSWWCRTRAPAQH
jgi:phage terminase large subunit